MGGDRASTTRMRLHGKICCSCRAPLPPSEFKGERFCDACAAAKATRRRVYMSFTLTKGWFCQFLEEDAQTTLPRTIRMKDTDKIFELAERGGYRLNLEGRQAIQHGIDIGRGGVWLELTEEQYAKLRKR